MACFLLASNFVIHKMGCDSQWGNEAFYAEEAGNLETSEGLPDFKGWITGWFNGGGEGGGVGYLFALVLEAGTQRVSHAHLHHAPSSS